MPTSIAGDEALNDSVVPADEAPSIAAGEQGLVAPKFASRQEGDDASAADFPSNKPQRSIHQLALTRSQQL